MVLVDVMLSSDTTGRCPLCSAFIHAVSVRSSQEIFSQRQHCFSLTSLPVCLLSVYLWPDHVSALPLVFGFWIEFLPLWTDVCLNHCCAYLDLDLPSCSDLFHFCMSPVSCLKIYLILPGFSSVKDQLT